MTLLFSFFNLARRNHPDVCVLKKAPTKLLKTQARSIETQCGVLHSKPAFEFKLEVYFSSQGIISGILRNSYFCNRQLLDCVIENTFYWSNNLTCSHHKYSTMTVQYCFIQRLLIIEKIKNWKIRCYNTKHSFASALWNCYSENTSLL